MENNTEASGTSNAYVSRVGIKVPPFWEKNPARWFSQIEAQFALSNITSDETKFHHIVANLDPQVAEEVGDIIDSPPSRGKYEKIKAELIARLSASAEQQIRRLLEGEEMGDRRPSQFLRHLRGLAGTAVSDTILRSLWMGRLPTHAQTILTLDDDMPLEKVAQKADKVLETMRQCQPQVAATSERDDSRLYQAIEALEKRVSELFSAQGRHANRPRSRTNSRPRSRSRPRNPGMCWYHNRFAAKAKKCTPPCSYATGNENAER